MEDIYCFAGNPLDRVSERRDDRDWIASLLADPQTRILALRDLKPFTRGTGAPALDWQAVGPWRGHIDSAANGYVAQLRAPAASARCRLESAARAAF